MKKRILIILTLLFLTGCTCEYNLTIEGNVYKEKIILTSENYEEISNFNNNWQIPIDKEIYNIGLDPSTENIGETDLYNHNLQGSKLTFTYDFTKNEYPNSSAVSNCYNKITVSNYENSIVISTNNKVSCFTKYPNLNNLKVTVKVDKPVISNNADDINGNTYIWNITKENADNKPINLVLNNETTSENDNKQNNEEENPQQNVEKKQDYTMFIFLGFLLVIM